MEQKKKDTITGISREPDNMMVQKSMPLISLWQSDLTLSELKMVDAYLSRIDSHKPEIRTVRFRKGILEKLLGVKRIRAEDLDLRLKHLGTPVRINDKTAPNKRFARLSLFETAIAEQDEYGLWDVELTASQAAMKYIFNIENLGYLKYRLKCITSITSRYSYILFIYLEANRYRLSWDVPLDELKRILSCDKEETYKSYKRFNDLILKRCQKELHEKTECHFSYEPIKNGRTVTTIRFTLDKLSEELESFIDPMDENLFASLPPEDPMDIVRIPIEEFSHDEQELLIQAVLNIPLDMLPKDTVTGTNARDFRMASYLEVAMAKLRLAESRAQKAGKTIKNRFNYLMKIIENDNKTD